MDFYGAFCYEHLFMFDSRKLKPFIPKTVEKCFKVKFIWNRLKVFEIRKFMKFMIEFIQFD